jgi:LacI family transcriptional regulator
MSRWLKRFKNLATHSPGCQASIASAGARRRTLRDVTSTEQPEAWARRRSGGVSVREVAALAGVSLGTVSNVLNRRDLVAPATLARVELAMTELGYVRNVSARQLRAGSSRMLGVMVPDVGNPFWGEVVRGVEAVASDAGYAIMVCSSDEVPAKETRNLLALLEHRVDGLLLAPVADEEEALREFRRRAIRVVMLDHLSEDPTIASVAVDDIHGGAIATEHLLARGHRRIAMVNGERSIAWCADRRTGAHRAVAARGLDPEAVITDVPVTALNAREGERIGEGLLAHSPAPTAVLCANDLLALGVLRALTRRGVQVPGDVALVGYDDVDFAAVLSPPLTTVRQEPYRLGREGVGMLFAEPPPEGAPAPRTVFRPELVVRDSA